MCAGTVTVIDPAHPLYEQTFKLSGLATLPGNVRHCHVELYPGRYIYVPLASTDRKYFEPPAKSILTADAIVELLTLFQTVSAGAQEANHGADSQSRTVAKSAKRRARQRRQ